jgi:hypothetical protein
MMSGTREKEKRKSAPVLLTNTLGHKDNFLPFPTNHESYDTRQQLARLTNKSRIIRHTATTSTPHECKACNCRLNQAHAKPLKRPYVLTPQTKPSQARRAVLSWQSSTPQTESSCRQHYSSWRPSTHSCCSLSPHSFGGRQPIHTCVKSVIATSYASLDLPHLLDPDARDHSNSRLHHLPLEDHPS